MHSVVEFAAVRVEGGEEAATCEELFAPRDEMPPHVEVLTRIRPSDLAGKPAFGERLEQLQACIGEETVIVGQNIGFDIGMLKGEGLDLSSRPSIDTSILASLAFPEERSFSLGHLSRTLGLPHAPVHRAMGDVRATLALFERCMERLVALPPELLRPARDILARSSAGYRLLADALGEGIPGPRPHWLACGRPCHGTAGEEHVRLQPQSPGTVELLQDDTNPALLSCLLQPAEGVARRWIGVKNLESALKVVPTHADMRVIYPPFLLLNPEARAALLAQESFTSDEATLAVKLLWHEPAVRSQVPIHGDERAVWNGKLACTSTSPTYARQFEDMPQAVLLDHDQLLGMLADPSHPGSAALAQGAHVLVDDASMLEDTATRAYGHECAMDDLRAASGGSPSLTRLTDLAQIWMGKRRGQEETHYLTAADLRHEETVQLRALCDALRADEVLPGLVRQQLAELSAILACQPDTHILWMEKRRNGADFLHAVPKRISDTLRTHLYASHPTTLIVPPGPPEHLRPILGAGAQTVLTTTDHDAVAFAVSCEQERTAQQILADPPAGKTVVLLGSKRLIEMAFVEHTERLEEKGVTLICQGLSGGQNRMEAEFISAQEPALWLLTPWTYEGTDLPSGTLQHLVIDTLPFDFPGHAVLGKRADEYANGFRDYLLPRMQQRLFRLLRTFRRHAVDGAEVLVLDKRLWSKEYGKGVLAYLQQFSTQPVVRTDGTAPLKAPTKAAKSPTKKAPESGGQQTLF